MDRAPSRPWREFIFPLLPHAHIKSNTMYLYTFSKRIFYYIQQEVFSICKSRETGCKVEYDCRFSCFHFKSHSFACEIILYVKHLKSKGFDCSIGNSSKEIDKYAAKFRKTTSPGSNIVGPLSGIDLELSSLDCLYDVTGGIVRVKLEESISIISFCKALQIQSSKKIFLVIGSGAQISESEAIYISKFKRKDEITSISGVEAISPKFISTYKSKIMDEPKYEQNYILVECGTELKFSKEFDDAFFPKIQIIPKEMKKKKYTYFIVPDKTMCEEKTEKEISKLNEDEKIMKKKISI